MRSFFAILILSFIVTAIGCNSNATVGGKVTFEDGSPLNVGMVVFDSGALQATGSIGADGTYTLDSGEKKGVPKGTYGVYITGATTTPSLGPSGMGGTPPRPLLDAKFDTKSSSGLICNVDKGKVTFDITVTPPAGQ